MPELNTGDIMEQQLADGKMRLALEDAAKGPPRPVSASG
jgi:hypothetical protein